MFVKKEMKYLKLGVVARAPTSTENR